MEKPRGLRLVSHAELRPGDLVLCLVESGDVSYFEFFFILSVSLEMRIIRFLMTSRKRGVQVSSERVRGTFTSKGIVFRDWVKFSRVDDECKDEPPCVIVDPGGQT